MIVPWSLRDPHLLALVAEVPGPLAARLLARLHPPDRRVLVDRIETTIADLPALGIDLPRVDAVPPVFPLLLRTKRAVLVYLPEVGHHIAVLDELRRLGCEPQEIRGRRTCP